MARTQRSGAAPTGRALRQFLASEVTGGVVLVAAAAAALVWANSPWSDSYRKLWATDLRLELGRWALELDLRHWINDGLMSFFFVLVAMEVKRELLEGELRGARRAAFPVIAAVGGMVVPAAIFLAFNVGGQGSSGWGIPMATDIAFALGVAALVARALPPALRLFLLALAIVDDIGAILVIALFYSEGVAFGWVAGGAGVVVTAYLIQRSGVIFPPLFVGFGACLWFVLHESGLHPTLAGVVMGLLVPTQAALDQDAVAARRHELLDVSNAAAVGRTRRIARQSVSPMEWLEHGLHPWTSVAIVPLFALANAGVSLSGSALGDAARSSVAWGVLLGLVVGKTVGITGFAWVAARLRVADLPPGASWRQLTGTAALAGIGFTVSIFITGLAFDRAELVDEAKIGILAASLLATLVATGILLRPAQRRRAGKDQA